MSNHKQLISRKLSLIKFSFLALSAGILVSCANDLDQSQLLLDQNLLTNTEAEKAKGPSKTPKAQVEHGIFQGIVTEKLEDDNKGLKHEHFMVKLSNAPFTGQIVKIAHDVNYAPYVPVVIGSPVEIKGDLITNAAPMVLHWTHHAEGGTHPGGYIKFAGKVYQ